MLANVCRGKRDHAISNIVTPRHIPTTTYRNAGHYSRPRYIISCCGGGFFQRIARY